MKICCTGASGKVGQRLVSMGVVPLECDVTDLAAVEAAVKQAEPDVICHLAGSTDVEYCEVPTNKELVIKTNLRGTWNVALAASAYRSSVALLSTDHVFDGRHGPYKETDHPKNPVNFYGISKMAAEALQTSFANIKIVRTSYLFNYDRILSKFIFPVENGSFPAYPDEDVVVPTFLQRSFMYEGHFAESLYQYLLNFHNMPPILHISGSDTVSWYEFALAAASVFDIDKSHIHPRKKEIKDGSLAPRPKKAGLQTRLSAKFLKQYSYIDGLKALKEEQA